MDASTGPYKKTQLNTLTELPEPHLITIPDCGSSATAFGDIYLHLLLKPLCSLFEDLAYRGLIAVGECISRIPIMYSSLHVFRHNAQVEFNS